MSIWKLKCSKS